MSDQSYYDQPTTLEEIKAIVRDDKKATQAERRFLGRISYWAGRGLRFKLTKSFTQYDGYSFTAYGYASDIVCRSSASVSWTLRLPRTASKESCLKILKRKASLRFFGSCHDKSNQEEQLVSISLGHTLTWNQQTLERGWNERHPETAVAVDGLSVNFTL